MSSPSRIGGGETRHFLLESSDKQSKGSNIRALSLGSLSVEFNNCRKQIDERFDQLIQLITKQSEVIATQSAAIMELTKTKSLIAEQNRVIARQSEEITRLAKEVNIIKSKLISNEKFHLIHTKKDLIKFAGKLVFFKTRFSLFIMASGMQHKKDPTIKIGKVVGSFSKGFTLIHFSANSNAEAKKTNITRFEKVLELAILTEKEVAEYFPKKQSKN